MDNHFYHIRCPPLDVTIFITHVRNCVMGATPMITLEKTNRYIIVFIASHSISFRKKTLNFNKFHVQKKIVNKSLDGCLNCVF